MKPRVVALGGGHGLAASLSALRRVADQVTAVVTVADDGGSSGRLRRDLGVLPPGDLRMALAALCGDDEWGHTWSQVVQHRFRGGELHGHSVGNLLIVALWERLGDTVAGLDWLGRLLGARGRVLPMSSVPLDIEATVDFGQSAVGVDGAAGGAIVDLGSDAVGDGTVVADVGGNVVTVRGQVAVASTPGEVLEINLAPPNPPACPEALAAIREADWVVLGPGSWYTSVLPHLLVPELAEALTGTRARRLVALNLAAQPGETSGFSPQRHLEVLAGYAPGLRIDVVLADTGAVADDAALRDACAALGAEVVLAPVAMGDGSPRHDPERLAVAYEQVFTRGRIDPWP